MFRSSELSATPAGLAALLAAAGVVATWHAEAIAQDELTAPPRIAEEPVPEEAPAAADSAATSPGDLEEIVVVSDQNPWRLPDLGSSWRAQQEEERDTGRISAELLPLWNPDAQEIPTRNPFDVTDDFRRVGFIEVFRIRFGGR